MGNIYNEIRSNFEKSFHILREEGVKSFLLSVHSYMKYNCLSVGRHLTNKLWQIKGERTLEIDGVSATFGISTLQELHAIRRFQKGEEHEYMMIKKVLQELNSDDVFFDIGSNIGVYSCLAAERANNVVAFEPHPVNLSSLKKNVERNKSNVQIKNVALSDSVGEVNFSEMDTEETTSTAAITSENSSKTVESKICDKLVQSGNIPQPNVVKIDVEGAEPLVLKGMRNTLMKDECRVVFCEIHLPVDYRPSIEDHGYTYKDVKNMLIEMGFEISVIQERGSEILIMGKK